VASSQRYLVFVLLLILSSAVYALDNPLEMGIDPRVNTSRTVYTAPYSQNFDGIIDASIPEDWSFNDNGYPDPMPFVVYLSQACCFLSDYYIGQDRSFWSPWIVIPGYQYRLNFKWSHGQRTDYNYDIGRVLVFDEDYNSTMVWIRSGTAFNSNDGYTIPDGSMGYPGTGVWESIDLSRWVGQTIFILFEGFSGWGPAWYIDDFSVQYQDTSIGTFPATQDFSAQAFPPPYWEQPGAWEATGSPGDNPWARTAVNGFGATGSGSAVCSFAPIPAGSYLSLTTPFLTWPPYAGSITFDYAYGASSNSSGVDQFLVEYSLDSGASFSTLATYNNTPGGGLVTAAPHSTGEYSWVPSASEWASRSLELPPGTNRIRFRGISGQNGRLFVDNIRFDKRYFAAGSGTTADPFQLSTPEDLNNLRNYLGNTHSDKCFKLMNDIDFQSYLAPGGEGYATWGSNGWLPLGSPSNEFYGSLDGNGYTISNLRTTYYGGNHGLFAYTAPGSTITNLNLASNCYFLGDNDTGAIVGSNSGNVINCSSAAEVRLGNAQKGGGICGTNLGSISGCTFTGIVSRSGTGVAASSLGGIAGRNESGATISNCISNATITGNLWNGGLVGWNNGTISCCASLGTLICSDNSNGGLVGQNAGSINNSYARVNVSGAHFLGGLVGYHGGGSIINCYSTGTVRGGTRGGLTGASGGSVSSSYWDIQTSGISTSFGGTGKTTAQMLDQTTYLGWDFWDETANGTNDYWCQTSGYNSGYPFLFWERVNHLSLQFNPGLRLSWDSSPGAAWYGIYSGTDPEHLTYRGYTTNSSLMGASNSPQRFFRVSAGRGDPSGVLLNSLP
jgi:hypothetical protein